MRLFHQIPIKISLLCTGLIVSMASLAQNQSGNINNGSDKSAVGSYLLSSRISNYRKATFISAAATRTADSLALVNLYNQTKGASWTKKDNWLVTGKPISSWYGVTFADTIQRVIALNLKGNNLAGNLPQTVSVMAQLRNVELSSNNLTGSVESIGILPNVQRINLANNKLTAVGNGIYKESALKSLYINDNVIQDIISDSIRNLKVLDTLWAQNNLIYSIPDLDFTNLKSARFENNKLDFEDIQPSVGKAGFVYAPQKPLGTEKQYVVDFGQPVKVVFRTGGSGVTYQWKRNNQLISGATDSVYQIAAANRNTVGKYVVEMKSSLVPDLTLTSMVQRVDANIDISGIVSSNSVSNVNKGKVWLLGVGEKTYFDTLTSATLNTTNQFAFNNVYLRDYVILADPDTTTFKSLIATYFGNVIYWDEADTLRTQGDTTGININAGGEPAPTVGKGVVSGTIEKDPGLGARILAAGNRVANAGVSLRRATSSGRTHAGKGFELVAYVRTDEDGNFTLPNLPNGEYNIKMEFPGIPMDQSSDVNLTVSDVATSYSLSAIVKNSGIVVDVLSVTGLETRILMNSLKFYPNPAKDQVRIKRDEVSEEINRVRVYNDFGMLIKEVSFTGSMSEELLLRTDDMPKGAYLIQVYYRGDKKIATGKLIKD